MKIFVNLLTMSRVLATILLPILWVFMPPLVTLIFVVSVLLTDFFDGFLARKFKVQTLFGCVADQFADKMFGIVVLLIIGHYRPIFYVVAIMEMVIALVNILGGVRGATTNSSFLGRVKMWGTGVATTFALVSIFDKQLYQMLDYKWIKDAFQLFWEHEEILVVGLAFVTIGAQLMVALDYAKNIKKEIKDKKEKIKYDFKEKDELIKVLFDTKYYLKNKNLPLSKHFLK